MDGSTDGQSGLQIQLYCFINFVISRSATGEAWQEIMLDCINKPEARCDPKSDDKGEYLRNTMS